MASLLCTIFILSLIRVMADEEAIIAMVDSNLQREKISHSEKAYAYMMKNEALKRKGGRKRSQSGHRLKGKKTVELISEAMVLSNRTRLQHCGNS